MNPNYVNPINQYDIIPSVNTYQKITFVIPSQPQLLWWNQNITDPVNQFYVASSTSLVPTSSNPTAYANVVLPTITAVSTGTTVKFYNPTTFSINLLTYDGQLLLTLNPGASFWLQTISQTPDPVQGELPCWNSQVAGASSNLFDVFNYIGNGLKVVPTPSSEEELVTSTPTAFINNILAPTSTPNVYELTLDVATAAQSTLLINPVNNINQITILLDNSSSFANLYQFRMSIINLGNAAIILQTKDTNDKINGVSNPANPDGYSTQVIDIKSSATITASNNAGWLLTNKSVTYQSIFRSVDISLTTATIIPYGIGTNIGYIDLTDNFDAIYSQFLNIVGTYNTNYRLIYLVLPNYFANLYNIITNFTLPPGSPINDYQISLAVGTDTELPYNPNTNPFAYTWSYGIPRLVSGGGNLVSYEATGNQFTIGYLVTTNINDELDHITFIDGNPGHVNITSTGQNPELQNTGLYLFGQQNPYQIGFGFSVNATSVFSVVSDTNGVNVITTGSIQQVNFIDFLYH